MKPLHIIIGLLVTALWGLNFVISKIGLQGFPPLLFTALRFATLLPCLFFVQKPDVPWKFILALGLLWGVFQFALLHLGLSMGLTASISALTMQSSVFFVALFSYLLLKESLTILQLLGLFIGFSGTFLIGWKAGTNTTLIGFALTLLASTCWGLGNIVIKRMRTQAMIGVMVWSSAVPVLPLLLLSYVWEGYDVWLQSFHEISILPLACVFYAGWVSTLLGGALWIKLLQMYEATRVTPLSLFVPFFSVLFSALFLQEPLSLQILIAAGLVVLGFLLNHKGTRREIRSLKPLDSPDSRLEKQPLALQTRRLEDDPEERNNSYGVLPAFLQWDK